MPTHSLRTVMLMVVAGVGLAGCDNVTVTRDGVFTDYEAGRYQQSFDGARKLTATGGPSQRDEMRFIAGVSAYRMGRDAAALRYLSPLRSSPDASLAGRSGATVGLIHARRGQDELAIEPLVDAAPKLSGDSRARAYYHAATSQQRLGRWASARINLAMAMASTNDPPLRAAIRQRQRTDSFAVQFGAFGSVAAAEAHRQTVLATARRAGLGEPAVVASVTDTGKTLYLVQAGRFASRGPAVEANRRTGLSATFVVPAISTR